MYVARVSNGFVPSSRRKVFERIRHLISPKMPFVNLPDEHESRWGESLAAETSKIAVFRHGRRHGVLVPPISFRPLLRLFRRTWVSTRPGVAFALG